MPQLTPVTTEAAVGGVIEPDVCPIKKPCHFAVTGGFLVAGKSELRLPVILQPYQLDQAQLLFQPVGVIFFGVV